MSETNKKTGISGHEDVNGWRIWYERYGNGPKPMLLMSGALGTSQTDFWEQLEGEDKFDMDKFTIIAPESPGWGRSKPLDPSKSPNRPYGGEVYSNDVECFYQLMRKLGFERFYVVGWSDGAIVGMWMACMYPEAIIRMAFHGILVYLFPKTLSILKSTRNVEGWGQEKLDFYLRAYESKEVIQKLWDRHLKFCDYFNSYYPNDSNAKHYQKIKFPLLVMHGDRDPISQIEHPEYVLKHVKHAKFHRFPNGNHDFHIRYTAAYKKMVEDFLLND